MTDTAKPAPPGTARRRHGPATGAARPPAKSEPATKRSVRSGSADNGAAHTGTAAGHDEKHDQKHDQKADAGKPAAGQAPAGLLNRLAANITRAVSDRVPRANLDERDPDYVRDLLPAAWLLATLWHRAEVKGLDRIPEDGPVLMVGNHSGGNVSPDTLVFTLAFESYFGVERPFYQLAHNLVVSAPHLSWLRKFGTVAASHANSEKALESGAALLVYPGGDWEVHRPSWESAKIDFHDRSGFVRLALKHNVPIVPVVAIGGQETALFLYRGEQLAKLLGIDRLLRLKVMPISIALPWGLNIGDLMTHFPLPAKIKIQVLDPIDLEATFGPDPDEKVVYDEVVRRMQDCLSELAAERRFPVLG